MKAATPSPRGLGKRSEGGEGAHAQGKLRNGSRAGQQRKEGRQEVRCEEWSEGDERHGRLSREVAVEHRGSDRDTTRAVQTEAREEVTQATAFSEHALWSLHQYASCDTRLVTGCGQSENSGPHLSDVRRATERGIAHYLDDWGPEDWPYWHHQM